MLPAAEINGSTLIVGRQAFMIGIDAMGAGILGWLANPVSLGAVLAGLLGGFRSASVLAALACALGASSVFAPQIARGDGVPITDVAFKVGFFLWLAAFSLIFATSCFGVLRELRPAART